MSVRNSHTILRVKIQTNVIKFLGPTKN